MVSLFTSPRVNLSTTAGLSAAANSTSKLRANSILIYAVLLSLANLRFGLEPVLKIRARLITSLDVEFVRSSLDALFDREHFAISIHTDNAAYQAISHLRA